MTSAFALEEARRNIAMKKPDRLKALEGLIQQIALTAEPTAERIADATKHRLSPKDAPILAAAIVAKVDALITGDRTHFGHLYGTEIEGVTVLTVATVLEKLVGK